MSSVMWDVVIIGAGISGASLANALCDGTSLRVMVIDRDDGAGGVWRQTKWSWLRSDTSAVLYSPTNSVGKSWVRAYGERGVPRDAIVDLTTDYVKRVHAVFNCRVKKCEWYHGRWHIECDTDTYVAKWVVDCSGMYQTPHVPSFAKSVSPDVRVVHSSEFDDTVPVGQRVAVVGSRESAVQIIQGLYAKGVESVDWYGRSFDNWYVAIDKSSWALRVAAALIRWIPCSVWRALRTRVHDAFMHWMFDKCLSRIARGQTPRLPNSYCDAGLSYHWSQPLRPVFAFGTHIGRARRIEYTSDVSFDAYDTVILATGFTQQPMFDVYMDGQLCDIDTFRLVRYIHPRHVPNMMVLKPLAVSSWVVLEQLVDACVHVLRERGMSVYVVPDAEYADHSARQDAAMRSIGMDEHALTYHARAKTFVYLTEFM